MPSNHKNIFKCQRILNSKKLWKCKLKVSLFNYLFYEINFVHEKLSVRHLGKNGFKFAFKSTLVIIVFEFKLFLFIISTVHFMILLIGTHDNHRP